MKLASHAHLRQLTGKDSPREQYEYLIKKGCSPFFDDGKVRIYEEVIAEVMMAKTHQPRPTLRKV